MKIFSKIKETLKSKRTKIVAASAIILSLVTGLVGANVDMAKSSASATPRFNFMQNDKELLTSLNLTQNPSGTNWSDPVSANIGDEVALRFYFHNGTPDTTAHNVTMRALLPSAVGKQHNVLSYLDSDETSLITDTVINGNIEGFGAGYAQVNTAADSRLEYIPGSTQIWRTNPNEYGKTMIDAVVNESGLNIGNVDGCWQYAGYLTFKVKVKAPAQLSISKYVAYPGSTTWSANLNNVKEGETVAWKIGLLNHGESDAVNVAVKDILPANITYIPGTTVYFGPDAPANGTTLADGITVNGLNVNKVMPGEAKVVYLVFQTRVGTNLPYTNGVWTGINTANATLNGTTISATARINVCGVPNVTIAKTVKNASGNWVEQINVKLGDTINYKIVVTNIGTAALTSINVNDVIPVYSKYINGSTKVNGTTVADGIAGAGIPLANLAAGQSATITLQVLVVGCPPLGDYTMINTAYVSATGVVGISDTASAIVHLDPIALPTL